MPHEHGLHEMLRIFNQYVSVKSVLLMVAESVLIVLALISAVKLRFWNDPGTADLYMLLPDFAIQCAFVVLACVTSFYFNDLYDPSGRPPLEWLLRTEQALGAAALELAALYLLFPTFMLGRGILVIGFGLVAVFLVFGRKLLDVAWKRTGPAQRVAVLGGGPLAASLAREVRRREGLGLAIHAIYPVEGRGVDASLNGIPVLGGIAELEELANSGAITKVIVALEDRRGTLPMRELLRIRVRGVRVEHAETALSALAGRIPLEAVKPSSFVFSDGFVRSAPHQIMKRVLDLAAAIVGLVLSAPIMALVALAVRLDSAGPVIYSQTRVGYRGKLFNVLKFRSMRIDAEMNGAQWAQKNDPRVTRVGRVIRKYRLDELPQFINVIRGDMSFVGPRPERPPFVEELCNLIPYYDERHTVRPGLTGWAQVQYAYGASVEDAVKKLEYDLFYLKNMSFTFDLAIIFETIRIVFTGNGGR